MAKTREQSEDDSVRIVQVLLGAALVVGLGVLWGSVVVVLIG